MMHLSIVAINIASYLRPGNTLEINKKLRALYNVFFVNDRKLVQTTDSPGWTTTVYMVLS